MKYKMKYLIQRIDLRSDETFVQYSSHRVSLGGISSVVLGFLVFDAQLPHYKDVTSVVVLLGNLNENKGK